MTSPNALPNQRSQVTFDPDKHEVSIGGAPISLTKTEFRVLKHLAEHQGSARSRRQIIDAVQGQNYPVTERSVDVQIVAIRKKLGPMNKLVETVRGKGFRFRFPEPRRASEL